MRRLEQPEPAGLSAECLLHRPGDLAESTAPATMILVLIRIEGLNLPGLTCGPGPDYPDGHHNVHVAVQGRKGQHELFGLVPADVVSAVWDLRCDLVAPPPAADRRCPQIHGSPAKRFVYITWGVVENSQFTGCSAEP